MRRIVIADDHALFREGMRQLLAHSGEFEVVGEAADAVETMQAVRALEFDVLVMDMSMPGRSGLDLVRQVRAQRPELPILVLSMHGEDMYAVRALAAGASAYLTKGSRPEVLLQALRRLAAGGRYISEGVAELLAREIQPHAGRSGHETLSDREFQIMLALVDGESVSEIAERLHLSVKTVSTHKANVLRKLHCATLPDLVRYAMSHNLGDTAPRSPPGEPQDR